MPIRRLVGVVALLVLFTGLAVGLYVDALRSSPVRAAEPASVRSDAPGWVHLGGSRDDVRAGGVLSPCPDSAPRCQPRTFAPSAPEVSTSASVGPERPMGLAEAARLAAECVPDPCSAVAPPKATSVRDARTQG